MFGLTPLPRTLTAALRDVRDPKPQVRISALRDLARLASGDAAATLPVLGRTLMEDSVAFVRAEAALAIADARAAECTDALVDAVREDASERVRQLALVALGEVAPKTHAGARATIDAALSNPAPELRFQAVIAIHRLAGDESMPAVMSAAEDDDAQVRYVCFRILEEHWTNEAPPPEVLELARRSLSDPSPEVRLAAALLLGRFGDRSGAAVITAALNALRRPVHPEDEHAAVELAGKLGLTQAAPALMRRAFGLLSGRGAGGWHARAALARLGDERARSSILRGLTAWSRETRNAAVAAAGRAGLHAAREQIAGMRGDDRRADPDTVAEALAALSSEPAGT